ncbi:MAG: pyridoxal-phosphate dependent enzyme [Gemmatimonadota bacterium]
MLEGLGASHETVRAKHGWRETAVNPLKATLPLIDRLPVSISHVALGRFPSPVEWFPAWGAALGFESLCVKREDLSGDELGGHKVRALEWLLPDAGPVVVTAGGFGSSFAATLASAARRTGRIAAVALFPQPWTDDVGRMLARTAATATVTLARSRTALPLALFEAWRGARLHGVPTWIPGGGASAVGVLGSVNAALEFVGQIEAGDDKRPDVIVIPLGSGGTAAGILLGLSLAGWRTPVVAVVVADRVVANSLTVGWLAWRARRLLARHGLAVPVPLGPLHVVQGLLGRGYGHPTPAAMRASVAAARQGLHVDQTYGAKTFAVLEALQGSFRRPCFWHTFDSRGTLDPPEEPALLQRAREYAEVLWPNRKSI